MLHCVGRFLRVKLIPFTWYSFCSSDAKYPSVVYQGLKSVMRPRIKTSDILLRAPWAQGSASTGTEEVRYSQGPLRIVWKDMNYTGSIWHSTIDDCQVVDTGLTLTKNLTIRVRSGDPKITWLLHELDTQYPQLYPLNFLYYLPHSITFKIYSIASC